ncbi:exopolysaccharide biosynthesis polyprenyl glycosylphosphotransferase [Terriglobus roseus DSM 18391]|uniref:Exopolysaccharide biosynthesis polyprenyl glycosylphosphotransferase n=1 Tax=Terriglobus roseus (strain DSM 18391 / NRRL B-41598 / KBS 63) TaxID=926566 RepID=I3ZE81_TERRK|nr:sugar transferase [Terriglobus roseus]AFL87549.1 exopolysaccharide biosynthesis polyprenyl glycosylphosphotransferase [Terriglobus roseus DSM 18391]
MTISGKALPPRAALLLSLDFVMLVLVAPMLFVLSSIAIDQERPTGSLLMSLGRLMAVGFLCQVIFYYHELYNLQVIRVRRETMAQTFNAFGMLFFLLAMVSIASPMATPVLSRAVLFAALIATVTIIARFWALPRRREQVLVVGSGEDASELQAVIFCSPEWNMEVSRIVLPADLQFLLNDMNSSEHFDRVIVTNVQAQSPANLALLLDLKMAGRAIEDAQSFFERATGRVRVDELDAQSCIFSDRYANRTAKRVIKRVFDLVLASTLLVLSSPLMAVTALALLLQRDGPVFYRQPRTGLFGRTFNITKFRSMAPVKPGELTGWAGEDTHRITTLGRHLRKYRIDELPQLIHVLKGEMSMVGPRPEQPHLCTMLEAHIPFYRHRHSVPPGLTGWAQVRYHYGATVEESKRKLEYDLFYVKHLSVWLDCAIALETLKVVLVGRGAL